MSFRIVNILYSPIYRLYAENLENFECLFEDAKKIVKIMEHSRIIKEINNIRLMVHENRRLRSDFRQIGQWIREGKLGDVIQCQMIMHRSGFLPDKDGRRPAVVRSPAMGTLKRLLMSEVFHHQFDVLRYLIQTCFDAAIAHFIECIRTGKPFESDARDNLETLSLVEDAYKAANLDSA